MPRIETVTGVINGDSFVTASRKHPVRLANVQAPERGEEGYGESKLKLAKLIRGREVTIRRVARDKRGRTVALVKVGGVSVNLEMRR